LYVSVKGKCCEGMVNRRVNKNEMIKRTKNKLYGMYKLIVDIRSRCVG